MGVLSMYKRVTLAVSLQDAFPRHCLSVDLALVWLLMLLWHRIRVLGNVLCQQNEMKQHIEVRLMFLSLLVPTVG